MLTVEHHPVHVIACICDGLLSLLRRKVFHPEQRDLWKPTNNEVATKCVGKLAKCYLIDQATALAEASEKDFFTVGPVLKGFLMFN